MNITKFVAKTFNWESIAKVLFWALAEILDMFIAGEELTAKEKKAVQLTYAFGKIFGETWIEETDNTLDDEMLDNILEKCLDTAQEGNFQLPTVPEIK